MTLDALKIPFRWYKDPLESNRNNTACKGGERYKLITPNDRLLPFIIKFQPEAGTPGPAAMSIINSDTGTETNANAITININYYRLNDWHYLVYRGDTIAGITLSPAYHYARLTLADGSTFESEEFWIDCEASGADFSRDWSADFAEDFGPLYTNTFGGLRKYTKIQWWHSCDIGNLLYQTGYQNVLYLDSELTRDTPDFFEEGKEDGEKTFIPSFQKLVDKILLTDYVPEHVLNALIALPLHKNVLVTTKDNLYIGRALRFEVSFTMEDDCHASVELRFQQENALIASACCTNNALEAITP